VELAALEDGVIVSNDQYRDLVLEKYAWRKVIETRWVILTLNHLTHVLNNANIPRKLIRKSS